MFSPFNMAMFRLNDPKYEDQAIATLQKHRDGTALIQAIAGLFLRLIWFDWFLDWLGYFKYQIQISSWWPTIRCWKITRAANYIWCLPKRVLYDNNMDIPYTTWNVPQVSGHKKEE